MKIDFEFIHPVHGVFKDALHLSDDHSYTDDEIQAMKQQRFDNWVSHIEAPPVETPIEQPVVEEPIQE